MGKMPQLLLVLLSLLLLSPAPARATDPDDLCTGDPCTVPAGLHLLSSPCLLNFAPRHLILDSGAILDLAGCSLGLTIDAGKFTMNAGSQIDGSGSILIDGQSISIDSSGSVVITSNPTPSFLLNGASGGDLTISSTDGDITNTVADPNFFFAVADALALLGSGGVVVLDASEGSVLLAGAFSAVGDGDGFGGELDVFADRDVLLGRVILRGGKLDGGILDITTDSGGVTFTGSLDLTAVLTGAGGELFVDSGGEIRAIGPGVIDVSAGGGGGDAGSIFLDASTLFGPGEDVIVDMQIKGVAQAIGCAGSLEILGANINVSELINLRGDGTTTCGAFDFDLSAAESLTLNGVDATAGTGIEATLLITSNGSVDLLGRVDVSANSGLNARGGDIFVLAGGPVNIAADLLATGDNVSGGIGGTIEVDGCGITVQPGVTVSVDQNRGNLPAPGAVGTLAFRDSSQTDLSGATIKIKAGLGEMLFEYRDVAEAPITTGTSFQGTPTIQNNPLLPSCDADGDGVLNFDDNCPITSNPSQSDIGGIGLGSGPDGIGDDCQCSDTNNDGRGTQADLDDIRRALSDPTYVLAAPQKCNVNQPPNKTPNPVLGVTLDCRIDDVVILTRALKDPDALPGIVCPAAELPPLP